MRSHRIGHYALLIVVTGLLTFPNLGAPSLWDMDEGVNAECTREMMESGTWIIPTFNWELRTAKPILTYWLARPGFELLGVNEFTSRLPSAILGILSVLLTYELGRSMFSPVTGLLAGVVLASAVQFCLLSHAATPDAPLIFCTILTFYVFWVGHLNGGRSWFALGAVATGLAVLAKGPVGLGLPGLVVVLYFLWNREWRRWFDLRVFLALFIFLLVAAPWYILVTSETRGDYARGFFGTHNVNRFTNAMEGHSGPPIYYIGAILVLFVPWSCYIGATLWAAIQASRTPTGETLTNDRRAHRLLLVWFLTFLVFFSAAQTKLPNYIAPLYPALALLTARFLIRWKEQTVTLPHWLMPLGVGFVAFTGVMFTLGMAIVGGAITLPITGMRTFPGLEAWAPLGLVLVVAAVVMAWRMKQGDRGGAVVTLALAAVTLIGVMAAGPVLVVDRYKAPKSLVYESGAFDRSREIRLASYAYFQESLVFYAERQVQRGVRMEANIPGKPPVVAIRPYTAQDVADFLATPQPGFLFIPEKEWEQDVKPKVTVPTRIAARHYDFYKNAEILVVTNEP